MEIGDSIKQAQETRSRTSKHLKQFVLAIVSTSLLVLDWWLLKIALFGSEPASFWVWPIIVTALWVSVTSLYALVNPDRLTFFIFNALGLVSYLIIMPRDPYIFMGGALFFLLSMLFLRQMQDETKNQLNFSIRRTIGNSQSIIVYALLVLIGFLVYSNISQGFMRDPDAFYRRLGETAVQGIPYISSDHSRYNLSQTVGDFFRKQAEEQYPEFNQVSSSQQRELLNQISENFSRQFGVEASENTSLRVAMTQVVTERIRESLGRFERFFPLFFTVALIALLRTFSFVFNWVVLLISWIFFRILLAFKFFRIEKQSVEVEKLEI